MNNEQQCGKKEYQNMIPMLKTFTYTISIKKKKKTNA